MLMLDSFAGINNVLPTYRLKPNMLAVATNVDIGNDGEITRRQGYSVLSSTCHKNVWQADGFSMAVTDDRLICIETGDVLHPALAGRVWYCNLPDSRTMFSNGLISGTTDGKTSHPVGVPLPADLGAPTPVAGQLTPGAYRWALTHVRLSDGLEGGAVYSPSVQIDDGGFFLLGVPQKEGYATNVYLNSGEGFYLAGRAVGDSFVFLGENSQLVLPLRNDHVYPLPAGVVCAFWRGRVLTAVGNVLWASHPHGWEHCDVRRDFKQFSANITLVQPVEDGVFVGTEEELVFLAGDQFDKLEYRQVVIGRTVLGSGVTVETEYLKPREGGNYRGTAMICIADGGIVYGYSGGSIWRVTEKVYRTEVTEVWATWRINDGVPQYLAVPV
jgi:hypothetical protein